MRKKQSKRDRITALIAVGFVALLAGIDQLTKYFVVQLISPRDSVVIIKGLFNFTHWHNDGAAFGILSGRQTFLITITGVFLVVGIVMLIMGIFRSRWLIASITLIIAGGIGNFIDRVSRGYVTDFIELKFINFAIFNFADMCAVIGSLLLFVVVVSDEVREYRAKRACQVDDVQLTVDDVQLTVDDVQLTVDDVQLTVEESNNNE